MLYLRGGAAPGATVQVEGSEAAHARRSLRLKSGDRVHLVDGEGHRYRGVLLDVDRRGIRVGVEEVETLPTWPNRPIWLGAGVLRSTRMDFVVEKASELGVERFFPLLLDRCVARPQGAGTKEGRWQRLAVESLKQSRRARLMRVEPPLELDALLERIPSPADLWYGDPGGISPLAVPSSAGEGPLVLLVGPEGGLTPSEIERLGAREGTPISLGSNRLRAETAGLTLLVGALVSQGELGTSGRTPR